jgi:hypothetical protein
MPTTNDFSRAFPLKCFEAPATVHISTVSYLQIYQEACTPANEYSWLKGRRNVEHNLIFYNLTGI